MKSLKTKIRQDEKGFTLVELAIVMIIVGLLIGGILKGQELIANAQVSSTVAQAKGLDAATSTFRDAYRAFPGDMANAAARLPNCAAAPCNTAVVSDGRLLTAPNAAAAGDALVFFANLAAADLLTGIDGTATVAWGNALPPASVGGGYSVGWFGGGALGTNATAAGSHYLSLRANPGAIGAAGTSLLTPSQAARIDRKMDDGNAISGSVFPQLAACHTVGVYNESQGGKDCELYIRIQG